MNKNTVFEHPDYRSYLNQVLAPSGESRGMRSRLAAKLGCQTGFISQVLGGNTHFSLEHALSINEFLGHSDEEYRYFMLLVHREKAGTQALRKHYQTQLDEITERRTLIAERIRSSKSEQAQRALDLAEQTVHYSSWHHGAVHVLLSIEAFQTVPALANHLRISETRVHEVLKHLTEAGLAIRQGDRYRIGQARVHLPKNSPLISKHHSNWRLKALQSLDEPAPNDLHYSLALSVSRTDAGRLRDLVLDTLQKAEEIFRPSPEEEAYSLCLDFFRI